MGGAMLKTEADRLLERIAKAMRPAQPPWHNDPDVLTEWSAAIIHRNAEPEQVRAVFDKWTSDGNTRWPNLYQFTEQLRHTRKPADPTQPKQGCDRCHGNGWHTPMNGDDPATINRHGITYTYCQPCSCPAGQHAETSTLWRELVTNEKQPLST